MLTAAVSFADIHLLQKKAGKVTNLDFNHKLGVACLCCSNPCSESCPPPAVISSCEAHAFAPGWDAEPRSLKNTHGGATLGSFLHRKRGLLSYTAVSQMTRRTLGSLPGRPLICLYFYSSYQFPEVTVTDG